MVADGGGVMGWTVDQKVNVIQGSEVLRSAAVVRVNKLGVARIDSGNLFRADGIACDPDMRQSGLCIEAQAESSGK
jgi:hypothetical protein